MRDSCQRRWPTNRGEFAAIAICTPAIACDAFHASANRLGATCRCSCIDVHVDSGAMSEIGRASCRERGEASVGGAEYQKISETRYMREESEQNDEEESQR